jgi:hypothetical protein
MGTSKASVDFDEESDICSITVSLCLAFPNLESLNLSNSKLTSEAMSVLGTLPKLQSIDFSSSNVNDYLLDDFLIFSQSRVSFMSLR